MGARFKADENLPGTAAEFLREQGHDAQTALEEGLGGCPDQEVIERCGAESRILVTLDRGFGDIRTYPPSAHPRMIVLHPARQGTAEVLELLGSAIALLPSERIENRLWICEPGRVRIRE